jgi:hypothetical protein
MQQTMIKDLSHIHWENHVQRVYNEKVLSLSLNENGQATETMCMKLTFVMENGGPKNLMLTVPVRTVRTV